MTHIRGEAETRRDDAESERLFEAARQLASATTRMLDKAKTCQGTGPPGIFYSFITI